MLATYSNHPSPPKFHLWVLWPLRLMQRGWQQLCHSLAGDVFETRFMGHVKTSVTSVWFQSPQIIQVLSWRRIVPLLNLSECCLLSNCSNWIAERKISHATVWFSGERESGNLGKSGVEANSKSPQNCTWMEARTISHVLSTSCSESGCQWQEWLTLTLV